MRFGKILNGEELVDFIENLNCSNCKKTVPGGMKTGKSFYKTKEFEEQLTRFKENYLCGVCRDQKRIKSLD